MKMLPAFNYDTEQPFFEILVPTIDTVRFNYLMQKLLDVDKPVFFTGGTGNKDNKLKINIICNKINQFIGV